LRYMILHSRARTVLLHLCGVYMGVFICGALALPLTDAERVAIIVVSSFVTFSGAFIAALILVNLWKYDDAFDVSA